MMLRVVYVVLVLLCVWVGGNITAGAQADGDTPTDTCRQQQQWPEDPACGADQLALHAAQLSGWGGDLERLGDFVKEKVEDLTKRSQGVVDGIVNDIKGIWDAGSQCLGAIGQIGRIVFNRQLEYHTAVLRTMWEIGMLPEDIIVKVYQKVAPQLVDDPKPQLWRLMNPTASAWGGEAPDLQLVDASALDFRTTSFFYVHGTSYDGTTRDSLRDWRAIVETTKLFTPQCKNGGGFTCTDANCHVYLLVYKTLLQDAALDVIIRDAFSSVLGYPVTGSNPLLTAAVIWRELERRAIVTGDYLADLLAPLPARAKAEGVWMDYRIISHSLGAFVVGHAGEKVYSDATRDSGWLTWYNLAGALPDNAFSATGIFPNADKLMGRVDQGRLLKIYYSPIDSVLSTVYYLATITPAMGQFGSSAHRGLPGPRVVDDYNTIEYTGAVHRTEPDPATGRSYIQMLGRLLKNRGICDPEYPHKPRSLPDGRSLQA